eukprot:g2669.t1
MESKVAYVSDDSDDSEEDEDSLDEGIADMKVDVPKIAKGRRNTVVAATVDVEAGWKPPHYDKPAADVEALYKYIFGKGQADGAQLPLFANQLDPKEEETVIGAFESLDVANGDAIITQGDTVADKFYCLAEGSAKVTVSGQDMVDYAPGACFGELALLYDAPRAATVSATSAGSRVWALDRVTFKSILCRSTKAKASLHTGFLKEVEILQCLNDVEVLRLADALTSVTFEPGQPIIREGEEGGTFFIVDTGEVKVTKGEGDAQVEVSDRLTHGAYFGEIALLTNEVRRATVTAVSETTCLTVDRKTFKRLLGGLQAALKKNMDLYDKYVSGGAAAGVGK